MVDANMTNFQVVINCVAGMGAVLATYFAFILREFVEAARGNKALGIPGTLLVTLLSPMFWLIAIPAFCLVFWAVSRATK